MKKCRCLFCLLLAALLLCGCGAREPSQTATATGGEPEDTAIVPPASPGNDLIAYDPDRTIYFTCHNCNYDIYYADDTVPILNFQIISKYPIDLSEVEIHIDVESGYFIPVAEEHGPAVFESIGNGYSLSTVMFPYYLYLRYLGEDWTGEEYENATMLFDIGTEQASAYEQLTADDLPRFYSYEICVAFENVVEESFHEIEITIGGTTYREEIGEIRLHPEYPANYTIEGELGLMLGINGVRWIYDYYTDGLGVVYGFYQFEAPFDMELLHLEMNNPGIELLDANVTVQTKDGTTTNFYWDGTSSIYLSQGDHINIDVYYNDPKQIGCVDYTGKLWGALDVACADGNFTSLAHCLLTRFPNMYEVYAIVFDGLDMEPYYRNYLQPVLYPWRQQYL